MEQRGGRNLSNRTQSSSNFQAKKSLTMAGGRTWWQRGQEKEEICLQLVERET